MYSAHGTYPMQDWRCEWIHLCHITEDEAETLILDAIFEFGPMNEFDQKGVKRGNVLLNKAFRIVFSKFDLVFAVYNYDGNFKLLVCPVKAFVDEMHRKGLNLDKTPGFPSL